MDDGAFAVLETVRQVVTNDNQAATAGSSPRDKGVLIKEVETTTAYRYNPRSNEVSAVQRTATFLTPSNQADPLLAAAVVKMGGQAVDVRSYELLYTKAGRQ